MRSSANHPAGSHGLSKIWPPMLGWEVSTQFAQQFVTAVAAPPLVGCVVWSLLRVFSISSCHGSFLLSFSSSAISASTLSNHVFLGFQPNFCILLLAAISSCDLHLRHDIIARPYCCTSGCTPSEIGSSLTAVFPPQLLSNHGRWSSQNCTTDCIVPTF